VTAVPGASASAAANPADGSPPGIAFRALQARDLAAVLALEKRAFSTPWDESAFRSFLGPGSAFSLVALAGDDVLGYALGWCDPPEAELMNLAVDPARRGRGVGSALLERVLAACARRGARELFLEVRVSNAAARRLYARHGFETVGRRRGYYASPREDALVYRARLRSPATRRRD
jgi:ribosomal-protein-alanine N-acetyltransferase